MGEYFCPAQILVKQEARRRSFGQTVCTNCFQLGLLGWVVFWGGFLSLVV